ncbi:MAG TPA: YihY/virulence factor BrkB family protein [Casimicrobiaceae bacterium]|nr:YihY/virulence factor BrkB family protein [Casimicrobiaceae bacterium]
MRYLKSLWSLTKESVSQFSDDFAPSMGAALAYYTIFSIAPLLVIAIAVAGIFFGEDAARGQIFEQLRGLLGDRGAGAIEAAVKSAGQTGHSGFAAIIGIITLLIGATTVFGELQSDLDRIWDSPKPKHAGLWGMVKGRLLSFGMVFGIGFLLLVSLVVSAGVSALGKLWGDLVPGWEVLLQAINFIVSFAVITGLFAMIYKLLPRCEIGWKDVWIGAGVTSLLFAVGKLLIGLYLGRSSAASSFGAAGSLVIVLLWVYYSAQIFLLGAEFTRTYSYRYGSRKGQEPSAAKERAPQASKQGETKQGAGSAGTRAPRKPEQRARPAPAPIPDVAGPYVPVAKRPMPAAEKLKLAAGIAATVGLLAGEVLNELRRRGRFNGRLLRRT